MDERSNLVSQLRIDRDAASQTSSNPPLRWIAAAATAIAAVGAAAWFLLASSAAIPISVATAEPAAAETALAAPSSLLDASGYVVARRQATVSAKITGKVVEVLIEEGQQVEAGDIIARLDDTNARAQVAQARAQLNQQRASFAAALIAFTNAAPTFDRNRQQFERAVISAQTFDTAKASYDAARASFDVAARAVEVAEADLALTDRALDDTIVRAPFGGVVTVKAAQEGEMVSPISAGGGFTRTGIGTIVDMDSLEVEVDVSENFINRVQPGQDVSIVSNAYPDSPLGGTVIAIIPTADRAKATVKVRVGFNAKDARILPQMGVRVAFLADSSAAKDVGRAATTAVVVPARRGGRRRQHRLRFRRSATIASSGALFGWEAAPRQAKSCCPASTRAPALRSAIWPRSRTARAFGSSADRPDKRQEQTMSSIVSIRDVVKGYTRGKQRVEVLHGS